MNTERKAIVDEAMSWVGTPYLHMGNVKGKDGGVDCAMIVVETYKKLGHAPADLDPRPYPMQWFLHRDEERFLEWFKRLAKTRVKVPQVGDIVVFRFGRTVSHAGIIVADDVMVHAYREAGEVIVENISAHAERFHSYWSVF